MSGILLLMCMQVLADSPRPYKLRVLTFEDNDVKEGFEALAGADNNLTFNDNGIWSGLIDNPQFGGTMLYGESGNGSSEQIYTWYDGGNTFLGSELKYGSGWSGSSGYAYWSGGEAISNYWSSYFGTSIYDAGYSGYEYQLTIYRPGSDNLETSGGGHNGSDNFCVHYGAQMGSFSGEGSLSGIEFKDGVARVIDHIWVAPSTYLVHSYLMGDGFANAAATPEDILFIEAFGFGPNDGDAASGSVRFDMFKDANNDGVIDMDDIMTDWVKWDLSSLGEVVKVTFLVGGTDFAYSTSANNPGDLMHGAYFAYDDVAVRFERYKYERTGLTPGNYGTICLPRNVAANDYEGAVFYKVVGRTADWITLEEVTELEAGKAYIFQATAETLRAYSDDDEDRVSEPIAADADNVLQGCFTDNTVIPVGNWFLLSNVLYQADGANNYVDNNRAYLTDITPAASTPAPGRRRVQLPIQQAPTALSETEAQAAQAQKIMQNGVIYIKQNGYLYNIQGQIAK